MIDTIADTLLKGGPVMIPIFLVSVAACWYVAESARRLYGAEARAFLDGSASPEVIAHARTVLRRLGRYLPTISVLAGVAPLLGLLGTVTGMITTFRSIMLYGSGNPALMAGGISEALLTTEAGLVVAFPLVLFHNALSNRLERISREIPILAGRLEEAA